MKKGQNPIKSVLPQSDLPVFTIGVVAKMLGVHPRTLRIYEAEGLIKPNYIGTRRLYSQDDVQWLNCLRNMIHEEGISIPGLKRLLELAPCWKVSKCSDDIYDTCSAKVDFSLPVCNKCGKNCQEE
jgi:MerR family transcriptional regulator/heat shock protein HspR